MQTSQTGINLIKNFEGLRLKAYKDPVGVITIGYGHTFGVKLGQTITKEQAEFYLKSDLRKFEKGVDSLVSVNLNQSQFDALVSFSFNCGLGALQKSTLLKLLNKGDYQGAADQFLRWDKAGGRSLPGLTRRRKAERALFLTAQQKTVMVDG